MAAAEASRTCSSRHCYTTTPFYRSTPQMLYDHAGNSKYSCCKRRLRNRATHRACRASVSKYMECRRYIDIQHRTGRGLLACTACGVLTSVQPPPLADRETSLGSFRLVLLNQVVLLGTVLASHLDERWHACLAPVTQGTHVQHQFGGQTRVCVEQSIDAKGRGGETKTRRAQTRTRTRTADRRTGATSQYRA